MEYVTLNTGAKMPIEGFGVFQIPDAAQCEQVTYDAIKTGYRMIDTAAAYMNEEAVGKGIRRAIADGLVKREDLFVVSKIWVQDMKNEETAAKAIETSLKKLDIGYIDLYLEHQAMGDYFAAWRAMEKAYKDGKLKAIGVANFYPFMMANFLATVDVKPAVDQIEIHPFFQREDDIAYLKANGVQPMAWGPLDEGRNNIFKHPVLTKIGEKYGKTAAQVALRWNIDRGVIIIPKSVHVDRMKQNFDLFDFKLSDEDMAEIAKLDLGHTEIIDHFDPKVQEMCLGVKIHN